jgi:hypothetical protein
MIALENNLMSETVATPVAAGWFVENIRPWLFAAYGALAVLLYRAVLRFLILARQLGC